VGESDAGTRDFRVSGFRLCGVGVGLCGHSALVEECRGQKGGVRDDDAAGGC